MVQMNMALDFLVWDNLETCTLVSRRSTGDMSDTIASVRRHQVTTKEAAASYGAYMDGDVFFYVARRRVSEAIGEPKIGDMVIDDEDNRFTVLAVDHRKRDKAQAQTFRLQGRNLSVVFDLRDLITIEVPVRTLDSSGVRTLVWATKYDFLPGRVQKLSEEVAEERGLRGFQAVYEVTVDREVTVTSEDRIKWIPGLVESPGGQATTPHGEAAVYLDIRQYREAESLGSLPVIQAVVPP